MPYRDPEKQRAAVRESKQRYRMHQYGKPQEQACSWCGNPFTPRLYVQGRAHYCSGACRTAAYRQRKQQAVEQA